MVDNISPIQNQNQPGTSHNWIKDVMMLYCNNPLKASQKTYKIKDELKYYPLCFRLGDVITKSPGTFYERLLTNNGTFV